MKAMQEEYDSLMENERWELVDRLIDERVLICRWVFEIKKTAGWEIRA